MKCPNCSAEVQNSKFCEYCGTQITSEMKAEQDRINKQGCPRCGSSNLKFNREKQGEARGKSRTVVVRDTVGMCKDCGYTWSIGTPKENNRSKTITLLLILAWLSMFPIMLTIYLVKKEDMKPKTKYAIIGIMWAIVLASFLSVVIIGSVSDTNENSTAETTISSSVTANEESVTDLSVQEQQTSFDSSNELFSKIIIKPLFNGFRTEKIGQYAILKIDSSECTEEALTEIYFDYFEKNDLNLMIILYTDKSDNSGIHIIKNIISVNTKFEKDEYGDYSVISTEDEIQYFVDDKNRSLFTLD